MMYLIFVDADSDSVRKLADVLYDRLISYPDMNWAEITDGNRTLMMVYDNNEYKNPRTYVTVTYSINEYTDENRSEYNQRGVVVIETNNLDIYGDMVSIVNPYSKRGNCEIEELHPMMYMDYDYEPVELIAEDVKTIYLRFTCRKEGEKTGE